jgi:hypothetical protein
MRSKPTLAVLCLLALAASFASGCVVAIGNSSKPESTKETARSSAIAPTLADAPRRALIHHVVFIRLADPSQAGELIADCDRLLPSIPGVVGYWRGTHFDMGRANVIGDYAVGLEVAFESREAYQAYLVDPNHLELLEIWKPRWTGATIYDVWDPGTERAAASR